MNNVEAKKSQKTKLGLQAKPNFRFDLKTEPRPSHGQTRKALVETACVDVVNLLNRESRPRKKTSLTEKAQYIEIARSEKLKI